MGFDVDKDQLAAIARELRSGAASLDGVARALPEAVDAGFSSEVANAALARVGKAALALARQGDGMAANIDVAAGKYLATDHEAEDDVEVAGKDLEERDGRQHGPLHEAPPEPSGQQGKNHPQPTPATTAPAPPPPPN